jgi:ribonucleoside-diphosphate reductase alpha chain
MLPDVCRSAVRILDNTIDLTTPPTEGSRNHNAKYRTIGVGSMGLADWLAKNEIRLVDEQQLTPEASSAINRLYEDIGYYTTLASCELAEERGAYPAFNGSEWSKGLLMGGRSLNWISQYSYDYPRWVELSERIKVSGIRNSHIQAIAPNTSSSLIQGVTASILPTYSKFYTEKIGRGLMKVAPPFLQEKFWYYRENKYIHPSVIIDMTSIIQRWLTTGISMELLYNLAPNAYKEGSTITSYDYYLNFLKAWKSDIKTMYYIRSIPPDQDYTTTNSCTTCAN